MANTLDLISSAIKGYVVSPLNAFGIGGFVFNVQGDGVAQLSTDITDHYTEDNRALQDHMAIRPKKITLKGYVGELIYGENDQDNSILQKLTQKLTVITSYLPTLSSAATQIQEGIASPNATTLPLSSAANIYGLVKNVIPALGIGSNQQRAYAYFQALQSQAILVGVQTPWEFLTNMAVETIYAVQSEDSKYITDFSITFKQIRIASTVTTAFSSESTGGTPPPNGTFQQGVAALQAKAETPLGIVPGITLPYHPLPGAQSSIISTSSLLNNSLANIFVRTQ